MEMDMEIVTGPQAPAPWLERIKGKCSVVVNRGRRPACSFFIAQVRSWKWTRSSWSWNLFFSV